MRRYVAGSTMINVHHRHCTRIAAMVQRGGIEMRKRTEVEGLGVFSADLAASGVRIVQHLLGAHGSQVRSNVN